MKKLLVLLSLIILSFVSNAQVVNDTIKKAYATQSNYYYFGSPYLFGRMNNGHIYSVGFIGHYISQFVQGPLDVVRTDMNTGEVIYKTLIGTRSSNSALWIWCMDSLGNVYTGLNSNNRDIWKFNFKDEDSIYAKRIDSGFLIPNPLAYSISLGLDNHMYFGASSGGTYWSEYDPYLDTLYKHPEVDPQKQYVLSIQGDTDYVYCQTGQTNSTDFWAIKKSDDSKIKLWSIAAGGRFNIRTSKNGYNYVYFSNGSASLTYRLKGFDTVRVASYNGYLKNDYYEVNNPNIVSPPNPSTAQMYFDKVYNDLFYKSNEIPQWHSSHINSSTSASNIKLMFHDKYDSTKLYYVGDLYGDTYIYDYLTDSSYVLGSTGYNIYSNVQVNDSIFFWGNYPSGALLKWNKNRPWTAQKFINGVVIGTNDTTNPSLVGYFRSNTLAGFHHCQFLLQFNDSLIVAAGNVIRIQNTSSIAVYNMNTGQMYGYDCNKINNIAAKSIKIYNDHVLFSAGPDAGYTGNGRVYFYNPITNQMDDSLVASTYNFTKGFGRIYVKDDTLVGAVDGGNIYKIYLPTKQLVINNTVTWNTFTFQAEHGYIGINTNLTETQLHSGYYLAAFPYFKKYLYTNAYPCNDYIYYISGTWLIKISGWYPQQPLLLKSIPSIIKPKMDKIYPNPASSFIYMKGGSYSFYNEAGKEVLNIILYKDGRVDISELHPGMYFLIDNKTRASQKLMIIR